MRVGQDAKLHLQALLLDQAPRLVHSPDIDPVNPPTKKKCKPSPTGFYNDDHAGKARQASSVFCEDYASKVVKEDEIDISVVGHDDPPLPQLLDLHDENDDVY
ncbi:MAG: hypothetical protein Q9180_008728, partial [Flavoplaca navasiana]